MSNNVKLEVQILFEKLISSLSISEVFTVFIHHFFVIYLSSCMLCLMSDLLLLTQKQPNHKLLVVDYPILLHDIVQADWTNTESMLCVNKTSISHPSIYIYISVSAMGQKEASEGWKLLTILVKNRTSQKLASAKNVRHMTRSFYSCERFLSYSKLLL